MEYIPSFLLYVACFITSAWFIYLGHKKGALKRQVLVLGRKLVIRPMAILGVTIPSILGLLRYGIGADYASYLEIYQYFADGTTGVSRGFGGTPEYFNAIEPVFKLLAEGSHLLTGTPVLFFGIPLIITLSLLYAGLKRYIAEDKIWLAWLLTLVLSYGIIFAQVRQALAVAIVFYAVRFILEKKLGRYIAFVVIATLCHYSSLVFLPLYFVVWWLIKPKDETGLYEINYRRLKYSIVIVLLFVIALVVFVAVNHSWMAESTIPYLRQAARLAYFVNGDAEFATLSLGGFAVMSKTFLIFVGIYAMAFVSIWQNNRLTGSKDESMMSCLVKIMLSLGATLLISSCFIALSDRLAYLFLLFIPVALASLRVRRRQTAPIITIFVSCALVLTVGLNYYGIFPYRTFWQRVDLNQVQLQVAPINSLIREIKCQDDTDCRPVWQRKVFDQDKLWKGF